MNKIYDIKFPNKTLKHPKCNNQIHVEVMFPIMHFDGNIIFLAIEVIVILHGWT
jgi:hypothetical protein